MEDLDMLSSEVGKYRLVGWLFFWWFIDPPTVSMLSPTGEGWNRGVDLIDITAPRVGIVKLWAGEFLDIFYVCLFYLTNHVFSILERRD